MAASCHGSGGFVVDAAETPVILIGHPNVGKSVLFGALTGRYAAVSNYPGTTVEVTRGTLRVAPRPHDCPHCGPRAARGQPARPRPVIDTPGVHSIVPVTDDERVTRDVLLDYPAKTVVQVVDAKNLRRGLLIALELAEAGVPFVVDLNMADEASARGIRVDASRLADLLGVPVVSTVATRGEGVDGLFDALEHSRPALSQAAQVRYDAAVEDAIAALGRLVPAAASLSARSLAVALLAGDETLLARLLGRDTDREGVRCIRRDAERALGMLAGYAVAQRRLAAATAIESAVLEQAGARHTWGQVLGHWASHPVAGWPVLAAVLYLLYLFVGVLGAGTVVDLLEDPVFGRALNPLATALATALFPDGPLAIVRAFLVGPYGVVTMGLTYAFAIVLPIVGTFFVAFSVLEDSGYLPRLAVMLDRQFRLMGLNGKAVLPMILGLGCDTMATVTTRILETRKERVLVTFLLALAVPCSAQLGVVLGMISGLGTGALLVWGGIMVATLLGVGALAAHLIPGERSHLIMELPPLRLPAPGNVLVKTTARVEWYLREVVPVFVLGTAALFVLDRLSVLAIVERGAAPLVVGWLGLPPEATPAFLIGFLRRDYGAAGLFALARDGALSPTQTLVSLVVITLFMPCIANLMMIVKEHGGRTAAAVAAFIFPFAFAVGGVLRLVLQATGGLR